MPLHDFKCPSCETIFEEHVPVGFHQCPCPDCGATADKVYVKMPNTIKEFVVDYPGSKRLKAGYIHSHGDRPATKTQVQGHSFSAKKSTKD